MMKENIDREDKEIDNEDKGQTLRKKCRQRVER